MCVCVCVCVFVYVCVCLTTHRIKKNVGCESSEKLIWKII